MQLKIVAITNIKTVNVDWIEVETLKGNLIIQPGHSPDFIIIKPQSIIKLLLSNGILEQIYSSAGLIEIQRDKSTLILG